MNNKPKDEMSRRFSTYGLITAERILSTFKMVLSQEELLLIIKQPKSFIYHLLQVPLKNVLNGIILQQATDYQVYAQKLFVDYLLSEESNKGAEDQGARTRESLEEERNKLIVLSEDYQNIVRSHDLLISNSQAALIQLSGEWKNLLISSSKLIRAVLKKNKSDVSEELIKKSLNHVFIHCEIQESLLENNNHVLVDKMNEVINVSLTPELKDKLRYHFSKLIPFTIEFNNKTEDYLEQVKEISVQIQSVRTQFYEAILRIMELIQLLPEYKMDLSQDAINKEALYFDKTIGDKNKA